MVKEKLLLATANIFSTGTLKMIGRMAKAC